MINLELEIIRKKLIDQIDDIFDKIKIVEELDAYLDERSDDPFDRDWSEAYKRVELLKERSSQFDKEKAERFNGMIRMLVFKKAFKFGSAELAGYISDDFGLIFDCFVFADTDSHWVFGLFNAYMNGNLPKGKIPEERVSISFI